MVRSFATIALMAIVSSFGTAQATDVMVQDTYTVCHKPIFKAPVTPAHQKAVIADVKKGPNYNHTWRFVEIGIGTMNIADSYFVNCTSGQAYGPMRIVRNIAFSVTDDKMVFPYYEINTKGESIRVMDEYYRFIPDTTDEFPFVSLGGKIYDLAGQEFTQE